MLTPRLCQDGCTALADARGKPEMEALLRQHGAEEDEDEEDEDEEDDEEDE